MKQVIKVQRKQGVNASNLCFRMHSLGQEDAWLHCDVLWVSHPLSRWWYVLGHVCKTPSSSAWLDAQSLETLLTFWLG